MGEHARLSPSGASQWMQCPGSIRAQEGLPDKANEAAELGTAIHELAEMSLRSGKAPELFIDRFIYDRPCDVKMAEIAAVYVDYVNRLPGTKLFEHRLDLGRWVPDSFGTSDAVAIDEGVLTIVDLKTGGMRVMADGEQLKIYALGAFDAFGFDYQVDLVRMVIVQPTLDHIDEHEMTVKELLAWGEKKLKPAALKALDPKAPLSPSEKACRFCRAAPVCPALAQQSLDLVDATFDDLSEPLDLPEPELLNAARIAELLPHLDGLVNWASAVKEHAGAVIAGGGIVPGYKLVAGRSQRKWTDERDAEDVLGELLGEEAFVTKLVSPAQAEKLLGRKRAGEIAELISKPAGRPTLAPDADPRPAIGGADFNDLNED